MRLRRRSIALAVLVLIFLTVLPTVLQMYIPQEYFRAILTMTGYDLAALLNKIGVLGVAISAFIILRGSVEKASKAGLGVSIAYKAFWLVVLFFVLGLGNIENLGVAVLGGSAGMVGASILAGRAALKCGAGRVHLALLTEHPPCVDYGQPELMLRTPDGLFRGDEMTVIAAGPGMGRSDGAKRALRQALESPSTLLLDADALNLVSDDPELAEFTARRQAATLLTPHPAEAGRLLGLSTRNVQDDRVAAALAIAKRYRAFAALKGNGTIVAGPDGRWWVNPSGNAGMASAGMGDALTGLVAGLIAQGASPLDALLAGVWLHGAAGDAVAQANGGPLGITASDLIDSARALLNRSIYPAAAS